MEKKNQKKFFCFLENCIWIGCVKLSQLTRESFSSPVNVLTNSLEIFHVTKREFFQLNSFYIDQ